MDPPLPAELVMHPQMRSWNPDEWPIKIPIPSNDELQANDLYLSLIFVPAALGPAVEASAGAVAINLPFLIGGLTIVGLGAVWLYVTKDSGPAESVLIESFPDQIGIVATGIEWIGDISDATKKLVQGALATLPTTLPLTIMMDEDVDEVIDKFYSDFGGQEIIDGANSGELVAIPSGLSLLPQLQLDQILAHLSERITQAEMLEAIRGQLMVEDGDEDSDLGEDFY